MNVFNTKTAEAIEQEKIHQLIADVGNPALREVALVELSKRRENYEDLAPLLWHSFGDFLLLERNSVA